MLLAVNDKNEKILAEDASKSQTYRCPSCKDRLILKEGKIISAHFAHYPKTRCSSFSEGESMEHIQGKKLLYRWLSHYYPTVELEAFLPHIQQRPDLCFESEKKENICVEFQCSPLSRDEMIKRTLTYHRHSYLVWWVLGPELQPAPGRLSALQRLFVFPGRAGPSIIQLNIRQQRLELLSRFNYTSQGKLNWKKNHFFLENSSPTFIFSQDQDAGSRESWIRTDYLSVHHKYMKEIRYKNKKMLGFVEELYKHGENLQTVSYLIYQSVPCEWMIRTHPLEWKYAVLQMINRIPQGRLFASEEFLREMKKVNLSYYDMPLLDERGKAAPLFYFLDFLSAEGILTQVTPILWQKKQTVGPYLNEYEKMKDLALLSQ